MDWRVWCLETNLEISGSIPSYMIVYEYFCSHTFTKHMRINTSDTPLGNNWRLKRIVAQSAFLGSRTAHVASPICSLREFNCTVVKIVVNNINTDTFEQML